jgi:hypothetical protein
MTITSKFNAKCKKCNGHIAAGQQIEWSKEGGSQHITCPKDKASSSALPRPSGERGRGEGGQPSPYAGKFQRLEQVYNAAEQREVEHTSYLAAVARLKADQSASLWLREAARVLDFSIPAIAINDVKKLLQLQQMRISQVAHVIPRKEVAGKGALIRTPALLQQGRAS